jgi:hypothetical protein
MTHRNLAALAIAFGLTIAALAPAAIAQPVAAQQPKLDARATNPNGTFVSGEWTVSISYDNDTYTYSARNSSTRNWLLLSAGKVRREGDKNIYTWNNNGAGYQVIWQPQDPDFIRVRVTLLELGEVMNRLMRKV